MEPVCSQSLTVIFRQDKKGRKADVTLNERLLETAAISIKNFRGKMCGAVDWTGV